MSMVTEMTYHEENGLLYPNIEMPQNQEIQLQKLGKYGRMALNYLKENEKKRYNSLYRFGKLGEVMEQVENFKHKN